MRLALAPVALREDLPKNPRRIAWALDLDHDQRKSHQDADDNQRPGHLAANDAARQHRHQAGLWSGQLRIANPIPPLLIFAWFSSSRTGNSAKLATVTPMKSPTGSSVHSADTARLFQLSHFNDSVKPSMRAKRNCPRKA